MKLHFNRIFVRNCYANRKGSTQPPYEVDSTISENLINCTYMTTDPKFSFFAMNCDVWLTHCVMIGRFRPILFSVVFKSMKNTFSVCFCCFAESATEAMSIALHSVSHALNERKSCLIIIADFILSHKVLKIWIEAKIILQKAFVVN